MSSIKLKFSNHISYNFSLYILTVHNIWSIANLINKNDIKMFPIHIMLLSLVLMKTHFFSSSMSQKVSKSTALISL